MQSNACASDSREHASEQNTTSLHTQTTRHLGLVSAPHPVHAMFARDVATCSSLAACFEGAGSFATLPKVSSSHGSSIRKFKPVLIMSSAVVFSRIGNRLYTDRA